MAVAITAYSRGETSAAIRARVSPSRIVGGSSTERWRTLERWIEAARVGELFAVAGLEDLERRHVAEHVAHALAARAGWNLGDDLLDCAFEGAAIAA